jgi:hypothetical protein
LELVLLAEGITVSLRSDFELERVKSSHSCLGSHPNFSGNPPTAAGVGGRCGDGSGGDAKSWTPRTTVEQPLIRLDNHDGGGRIDECESRRRPRSNGCYCWGWNWGRRRRCDADEEAEARLRGDAEDTIRSTVGAEAARNQTEEWGGPRCGGCGADAMWGRAEGRHRGGGGGRRAVNDASSLCLTSILFRSRDRDNKRNRHTENAASSWAAQKFLLCSSSS